MWQHAAPGIAILRGQMPALVCPDVVAPFTGICSN